MAKTLEVLNQRANPLALVCSPSFYRRLGPLLPKHLGGKGYHMATKGEARCTIKVESTTKVELVDAVHGRGAASPKLKRSPSSQDGGLALQRLVVSPTMTSSLERGGRLSP